MYAGFGQAADFQTLPADTDVIIPSGTPLYVVDDTGDKRVVLWDTLTTKFGEPVDVVYEEAPVAVLEPVTTEPTPIVVNMPAAEGVAKSEDTTPWYKTPAFIGGVASVLVFSLVAFMQSRAEAKIK